MNLHQPNAALFIPDSLPTPGALTRVTHLGIGAHPDDLEFMAYHGILECFGRSDRWFGGITCTDGSGSARTGPYADFTNEELMAVRRKEQEKAAIVGEFAAVFQLDYPSSVIKDPAAPDLKNDLLAILTATRPEVVYTHNPADKHETHLAVLVAALEALRELPRDQRPEKVIGCEVWRDLDWLDDDQKILMDVSGRDHLAAALNGIFDSQIAGGKRYDLSTPGRRAANASYQNSHATDTASQLIVGLDLTPLILDETLDLLDFTLSHLDRFKEDVTLKLSRLLGKRS